MDLLLFVEMVLTLSLKGQLYLIFNSLSRSLLSKYFPIIINVGESGCHVKALLRILCDNPLCIYSDNRKYKLCLIWDLIFDLMYLGKCAGCNYCAPISSIYLNTALISQFNAGFDISKIAYSDENWFWCKCINLQSHSNILLGKIDIFKSVL